MMALWLELEENLWGFEKGLLPHDILKVPDRVWLVIKATVPLYWRQTIEFF